MLDRELADVLICRQMRWTWQEYRSQPKQFIDILKMTFRLDAEKEAEDNAKAEAKAREAEVKAKAKRR